MADGLSISIAIGGVLVTVGRVINQLQDFMSLVEDVDEAVKAFVSSVKNLETVLKATQKSLQETHLALENDADHKRMLAAIDYVVSDSQHTTSSLDMALRKLGKRDLNEYQATLEQLRAGYFANELTRIRWHISIYRESYQIYLLTTLIASAISDPGYPPSYESIEELRSKEQGLERHFKKLENIQQPKEEQSEAMRESEDDRQILEDARNLKLAAETVYNKAHGILNHWSSREPSSPLTPIKYEEIRGWVEELSNGSSSEEEPQVEQASAVRISRVLQANSGARSKFVEHEISSIKLVAGETVLSEYQMKLRTTLLERSVEEYGLGHYTNAYQCLQEAYQLGSIGTSPSNVMSDKVLKIWLSLSALRKLNLSRLNRGPRDSPTKKAAALWKELVSETPLSEIGDVSETESRNACLLAEPLIYAGELEKAESYCKFALRIGTTSGEQETPATKGSLTSLSLIRLLYVKSLNEPTNSEVKVDLYHNAILTMVHLLYAKGTTEVAKSWCERLSGKRLEATANKFFVQFSNMKPRDRLLEAIRDGNFYAALYALKARFVQDFHLQGRGALYLYNAVSRDSAAIVALLIQHSADIEDGPEGLEIAKPITPLYRAIECHNAKAAELLIRAGANKEHLRSIASDTSLYRNVHAGIRFVSTPLGRAVAEGLSGVVKVLLDHGAQLDGKTDKIFSVEPVLFTAIRFQAGRKLIPLLLGRGADVDQAFGGIRPLTFAILCDQVRLSPSAKSTSFIEADAYAKTSREAIVKWLIAAGANVDVSYSKNGDVKNQRSIVQLARKKGLAGIETALNKAGAKKASTYRRHTWR